MYILKHRLNFFLLYWSSVFRAILSAGEMTGPSYTVCSTNYIPRAIFKHTVNQVISILPACILFGCAKFHTFFFFYNHPSLTPLYTVTTITIVRKCILLDGINKCINTFGVHDRNERKLPPETIMFLCFCRFRSIAQK